MVSHFSVIRAPRKQTLAQGSHGSRWYCPGKIVWTFLGGFWVVWLGSVIDGLLMESCPCFAQGNSQWRQQSTSMQQQKLPLHRNCFCLVTAPQIDWTELWFKKRKKKRWRPVKGTKYRHDAFGHWHSFPDPWEMVVVF